MGSFRDFLTTNKELFNLYFLNNLISGLNAVKNVDGFFLILAEKSFGIYELSKIAGNPSMFFENLGKDRSYITICKIIESIFLSDEIVIENLDVLNLKISVINKNNKLLGKYVGFKNGELVNYIDKTNKKYKNFKVGEYTTLESFIKNFLNRFIPVNKKIKEFNILKSEA